MVRRAGNRGLQRLDDLHRFRLRFAIGGPVIPRHGVHPRLGIDSRRVIVLRIGFDIVSHGLGPGDVERFARGGRVAIIAGRQRIDQRLLLHGGIGFQGDGLVDCGAGRDTVSIGHDRLALAGHIDVRPGRQRLAPEAHGALRVECLGRPE